jgi:tryptophan synthase alpha chain
MKDKIALMTHQVIGYPDMKTNERALEIFEKNGVEYTELQIPFSDPSADGPTFVKANQESLNSGTTVRKSLEFIEKSVKKFDMNILIMTYYNIVYQYGVEEFVKKASKLGVWGLIIPDATLEDASELYEYCEKYDVNPVVIATPYTEESRLKELSIKGSGFIYYVPRAGVTGTKTKFSDDVTNKIDRIKEVTKMKCAVGFGIQEKKDIDILSGHADIAIIGSAITRVIENEGIEKVDEFLKNLMR